MHRRAFLSAVLAGALAAPLAARAGEAKTAPPNPYVDFGSVAVTSLRAGGRRGVMTVEVQLQATDPALRDLADLSQPYLRSAYVAVLQRYALGLSPGDPPSPDWIAMTLQRETDRVLKRRGAKVLLGTILVN